MDISNCVLHSSSLRYLPFILILYNKHNGKGFRWSATSQSNPLQGSLQPPKTEARTGPHLGGGSVRTEWGTAVAM